MIRLDKHIKWIESAESFQDLDGVIHGLLNENLFEHVTLELRAKIESLPMTGDLDGIIAEMTQTMPVLDQCMAEGYAFTIVVRDRYKTELFRITK